MKTFQCDECGNHRHRITLHMTASGYDVEFCSVVCLFDFARDAGPAAGLLEYITGADIVDGA